MTSIERIHHEHNEYAIIIRASFKSEGIKFFTPGEYSQQLAYMKRSKGYIIEPHYHNSVERTVLLTQEVLFIKSGLVKTNFYDSQQQFICSTLLHRGDVILLSYGGHGFEILEDSEIIEVKQGPYAGDNDKTRFDPVEN